MMCGKRNRSQHLRHKIMAVASVILISACSSSPNIEHSLVPKIPLTENDLLIRMNDEVSGFGGLYFDDAGDLNVYISGMKEELDNPEELKNVDAIHAKTKQVITSLNSIYGPKVISEHHSAIAYATGKGTVNNSGKVKVRLINAQYTINQLVAWYKLLTINGLFNSDGVYLVDINEGTNRISIGLKNNEAKNRVLKIMHANDVPTEAVKLVIVPPVTPLQNVTLDDRIRPVEGGIRIESEHFEGCTLGFNAYTSFNGISRKGFVTAAHCTHLVTGKVTYEYFYQNSRPPVSEYRPPEYTYGVPWNYIGYELLDPPYFTSDNPFICPPDNKCRYSDAAFILYTENPEITWDHGEIAQTIGVNQHQLEISTTLPKFHIISEGHVVFVGDYLNKVGQTTGWTRGKIKGDFDVCVDVLKVGQGITLKCQYGVKRLNPTSSYGIADSGDSGSPVFMQDNGNDVILYGLVWGASKEGSILYGKNHTFYFSGINAIESELGYLHTFSPSIRQGPTQQYSPWEDFYERNPNIP